MYVVQLLNQIAKLSIYSCICVCLSKKKAILEAQKKDVYNIIRKIGSIKTRWKMCNHGHLHTNM